MLALFVKNEEAKFKVALRRHFNVFSFYFLALRYKPEGHGFDSLWGH
jgi:hypothetical protein